MDPADTLADRCAKTAADLTVPALLHRNATEFADLPALTHARPRRHPHLGRAARARSPRSPAAWPRSAWSRAAAC